ncbi:flagellar protein FlgN [Calditerrivibrio nitroreducens]|uniref:FlgN family protein n=1 Tax=Calditerrivibrio nitroreducens (strain DSM 19672 / NBRC 101217 / Yu37-1) TaxID=768670 RepID=E4TJH0_CALNY|nr:flagellar protein FlgN [Calditerrivibrio nitroreducens]ADR18132.1 FlgN family protein [Calditerrivibrio nitroreducens DSM 19672]
METIQSLIGVLKQQIELYHSIYELLKEEKSYISKWQIDKTLETVKKKETLLYKEKILDESRDKIAKNIQKKLSLRNASLSELVDAIEDRSIKDELISLRKEILDITNKIYSENMAIKILYHTNLQLIRDFFEQIGMIGSSSYDSFGTTQTKPKGVVRTA